MVLVNDKNIFKSIDLEHQQLDSFLTVADVGFVPFLWHLGVVVHEFVV